MFEVDMHVHSHYSDGADSPTEVVRKAKEAGLKAVCLADHDTYAGLEEFEAALLEFNMDGLPAIEFSTGYGDQIVHILGYGIDYSKINILKTALKQNRKALNDRIRKSLELYKQAGIMDITVEELNKATGCRADIGFSLCLRDYRIRFGGLTREQARLELVLGGVAYTKYQQDTFMDPQRAVRLIKILGGVAVWAHPGIVHKDIGNPEFLELTHALYLAGLDGLEVYHPIHTPLQIELFSQIASSVGLITTGGSDFHGHHKLNQLGDGGLDYQYFLRIKQTLSY